jgi:excisionase family DNA binding protein
MKKNSKTSRQKTQAAPGKKLGLSLAEAEERVGVSRYTLRRMIGAGTLKGVRFRRRIIVPIAELENLMKPGSVAGGDEHNP